MVSCRPPGEDGDLLQSGQTSPATSRGGPSWFVGNFSLVGPLKLFPFLYILHRSHLDCTFSGSAGLWDPGISFSVAAIQLHRSPVKHPSLLLGVGKNSVGQPGTTAGKIESGCKRQHDQSRQGASVSVQAGQWANSETSEKRSGRSAYSKKIAKQQQHRFP